MKKPDVTSLTKRQLIKKSTSTVVLSMAMAAFIVAFSLVILNFLWGLSGHNNRVIAEKSEASKQLSENVENIGALQASFNVFEAGETSSSDVLDALPSKYDFPALATSMESLVARSGMTLKGFGGNDQEEEAIQSQTVPAPVEISFTLTVSGTYQDLQKLVDNIEKTTRPIKVVTVEIRGNDSSMQATIDAITYYQPATSLEVETRTIE